MRISDWSSDVCSSDLAVFVEVEIGPESRRAKPAADHLRRREAEPWQYRRSRRLVRHDCNPRCPDDAPGRGLEPVERVARPGTGDERRIVVRWRNDRRGAGLAVALPQQFDAVRATCGVAVADAERLPGDIRHRAEMGTFGVTF